MIHARIYDSILDDHLARRRQMAFVSGPRQVGKTTTARRHATSRLSFDDADERRILLRGPAAIAAHAGFDRLREARPVVLLDEIHKLRAWKALVKGLFDTYAEDLRVIVTGSARLEVYRRGGDSLMGRYLPYRMHPFSVAELATTDLPDPVRIVRDPRPIEDRELAALREHGGFPEPFLSRDLRFTRRWVSLRRDQLLRGDLRELTRILDLGQMETFARILEERSASQLVLSNLANEVQISVDTARRWLDVLVAFHLGFVVRPWFRDVARSLRKEPKWYLRDWAGIADPGAHAETFVACHLLKAVDGWNDLGLGDFTLGYLRDKERREVDFVVVRDRKPWFLVEVKRSDEAVSPALGRFQEAIGAPFAFQVVMDAPFVRSDAFARPRGPIVVPARTFLSQLF